ncbi:hypothetical protein HPB50_006286 [Hyalomma asiaticum]|uniref:Uncharacterized protein n=1 Tax=Hyalomma asiaticum TaxID=266040 RepID=A0ACB7SN89_HYAAI|nr:hypothetical protein HPB50_006286 [Hyalomma asiaticum]
MIKFCALNSNDTSSPQDDDDSPVVTREAQEEEAFGLYRKALGQLQQESHDEALASFRELLALPFISRCSAPPQDDNGDARNGGATLPPALMLKYVALKNLGAIQVRLGDSRGAVSAYLDAAEIDSTDVTLWYKIGRLALGLYLYPLARIAFQEGLRCSAQHWPCLSNLMTVLYVLNDDLGCLECAARALRLDPGYVKALAFREAVFRENPALKSVQDGVFKGCDSSVFTRSVSKEDAEAVLSEARELREKRRELYTPKKLPRLPLRKKLGEMSWVALGQAVLELYEFIATAKHDSDVSLACKVDLLRSEIEDKPLAEASDLKKESPSDSLQQGSGNSSGDLIICMNTPSDPTSQAELPEGQPLAELVETRLAQPTDLGSLAEQLTVVTQELGMPDENGGSRMMLGRGRRGGKRKRLSLEHLDPSLKRRSARVRNTLRKTQESINYQELLTQFLPSSLAYEGKDDREDSIPNFSDLNSDHTYGLTPTSTLQEDADKVVSDVEGIEKTESEAVEKFINEHAHEHLGRRSWCTLSDGVLLFLFVDVATQELSKKSAVANVFHEDLNNGIEQCFYCLYGHPHRRGKVKHLQEHNAKQVSLTWNNCKQVFDFFKPQYLPGFDSYKASTVSSELEVLLKSITALVPPDQDPSNMESTIAAYIDGSVDTFPTLPDTSNFSPVVLQLYYLLGDYYFKNKEFAKAIRYYTLDVCLNPERLDSWAGLALSRSTQIEQRINSCEPKNEATIQKRAASSLRCFKRALQIDASNSALWIEYGSCVYMLQSNISRQLKQSSQFLLSDEAVEALAKRKKELLETAKNCYESASRCEEDCRGADEMWLNHYLLGKITHKLGYSPAIYLDHLYQSLQHLYEMNAVYPQRIVYHSPPPLSIESLELYYKIHALSMKYLLKYEDTPAPKDELRAIWKFIQKAGSSPFAKFQEKAEVMEYYSSSEGDEESDETSGEGKASEASRQAKKRSLETDHDYYHAKKPHLEQKRGDAVSSTADTPSSADEQELLAVKEILDCLLSVVSEKLAAEERQASLKNVAESTVAGDEPMTNVRDVGGTTPPSDYSPAQAPLEVKQEKCASTPHQSPAKEEAEVVLHDEPNVKDIDSSKKKAVVGQTPDAPESAKGSKQETSAPSSDPFLKLEEAEMKQVLLKTCVHAMKECLSRFPQHFKSVYYLARFYCHSKRSCNLQLARDYLLDSGLSRPTAVGPDSAPAVPGLFAERKTTNFFTGIWHTPGDEIDRAGSFATHMYRSVMLLLEILERCGDVDMLAQLAIQLNREPEPEKKYLRDVDRTYLARKAFETAVILASRRLDMLMNEEPPPEDNVLVSALLDVYRVFQVFQKQGVFVDEAGAALAESYRLYKLGEVDSSPPIAEQAVMFCARRQHRESLRALEAAAHGFEQKPLYDIDGTAGSYSDSL